MHIIYYTKYDWFGSLYTFACVYDFVDTGRQRNIDAAAAGLRGADKRDSAGPGSPRHGMQQLLMWNVVHL